MVASGDILFDIDINRRWQNIFRIMLQHEMIVYRHSCIMPLRPRALSDYCENLSCLQTLFILIGQIESDYTEFIKHSAFIQNLTQYRGLRIDNKKTGHP